MIGVAVMKRQIFWHRVTIVVLCGLLATSFAMARHHKLKFTAEHKIDFVTDVFRFQMPNGQECILVRRVDAGGLSCDWSKQ